jgi:hypothetical protein
VGIGSTALANLAPFTDEDVVPNASIGFSLEAGGFYRRKPRLGSAFVLGVVPGAYVFVPRVVAAHRLYARRLLLAKPDFRVESLVNFDVGLATSVSVPGLQLGVGWAMRLVFRDRYLLDVRPVSLEITAPDFAYVTIVSARYGAALTMGTAF